MPHELTPDQWIARLDAIVQRKYGMSFHDMPDCFFWRDLYEDEISPKDALEACEVQWANHDPSFASVYYGS